VFFVAATPYVAFGGGISCPKSFRSRAFECLITQFKVSHHGLAFALAQLEPQLMSTEKEPEVNATATAERVVGPEDLASALPLETNDEFPPVFATARMIGLMEIAASRVLKPLCGPGELSVGVTVDVNHTAATPLGATVIATARYAGREGKLFLFEVSVADPGGEVGRGWHKRAIVSSERLQSGAARRVG
jgi:predicted thioesterase